MKNMRLAASIVLTILLCISIAYWVLKLIRPAERPLAAPPQARQDINLDSAAGLFGGRAAGAAVASNFQLRGVIDARNEKDSVAIIAASGKPAQAVAIGAEVVPGVTVQEVHPRYVLLSENGVAKRIELPEKAPPSTATASPVGTSPAQPGQNTPPVASPQQPPPKTMPPVPATPTGVTVQPGQPAQNVPAQNVQPVSAQAASAKRAQRLNSMARSGVAQPGT
jgi:general secretion pathway protein C